MLADAARRGAVDIANHAGTGNRRARAAREDCRPTTTRQGRGSVGGGRGGIVAAAAATVRIWACAARSGPGWPGTRSNYPSFPVGSGWNQASYETMPRQSGLERKWRFSAKWNFPGFRRVWRRNRRRDSKVSGTEHAGSDRSSIRGSGRLSLATDRRRCPPGEWE